MKTSGVDVFDSSSSLDITDDHNESLPNSCLSLSSLIDLSPSKESQLWLSSNDNFKQHYNSIMHSTNLVDSCVEALNDINVGDSSAMHLRSQNNDDHLLCIGRLSSGSDRRISLGIKQTKLTDDQVKAFEQWLTTMEERVSNYPTLSEIYAMEANKMQEAYGLHSKIFKDIVGKTCIVGNSMRNDHRALAERYHILYLRAYEVLILLEGMPFGNSRKNTNDHDSYDGDAVHFDDMPDENVVEIDADYFQNRSHYIDDDDVNFLEYGPCQLTKAQTLRTQYSGDDDDSSIDDDKNIRSDGHAETFNNMPYDKSLVSLFDNMDELYETLKSDDQDYNDSELLSHTPPQRVGHYSSSNDYQQRYETKCEQINNIDTQSYINRKYSLYEESTTMTTTTITTDIVHNKVYDWLNMRTINENSYEPPSDVRSHFVYIYKAKSETNMDANVQMHYDGQRGAVSSGSLHCTSSHKNAMETGFDTDSQISEPAASDCMHWDDYVPDLLMCHSEQYYFDDWEDYYMNAIEWQICYFGENYEHHLANSSDTVDTMADMTDCVSCASTNSDVSIVDVHASETTLSASECGDAMTASTATLYSENDRVSKRRRRRNNRRMKRMRNQQSQIPIESKVTPLTRVFSEVSMVDTASDDLHSMASEPVTASMHSLPSVVTTTTSGTTKPSDDNRPTTESPAKNIRYNSDEQSFEVFSSEETEPATIKHNVNELTPEDFHDIIKMCRNNIDCVITVLGSEPNRVLSVKYCQKMRRKRAATNLGQCYCQNNHQLTPIANAKTTHDTNGNECCCHLKEQQYTCLCTWVAQTIAMIINFLLDCWNIFRNMRLYTYLGKVLHMFFAATRNVTKRIYSQKELANALAYTNSVCY